MNILGLVFSLLLILSYGFYACWDKQTASNRIRTTYLSHEKANRKILNSYQSEVYKNLGRKTKPVETHEEEILEQEETFCIAVKPELNRECAKLNLFPLIQEGRERHPILYELAAKLIHTFYAPLGNREKRFEYHFLDALLASARAYPTDIPFAFEKLDLKKFQRVYYKMLRGTKEWNLAADIGYPPVLDYIKIAPGQEKLCLCHAHSDLFLVLFGQKMATALYPVVHQKDGPAFTQELVEKFCSEAHLMPLDLDLLALLEYGHHHHPELKKTLVATDNNVCLRKTVYLKDVKNSE